MLHEILEIDYLLTSSLKMEGLVSDRLKHYSFFRSNLLEKIKTPHTLFQNNAMFHCSVIFTTVLILIVVFAETKSLTLFSFHPICMSIGSLIFLAEGIIAYRNNGLLDTLSPIMQHSKRTKVCTFVTIFLLLIRVYR
jgi:hypothetical protein